MYHYTDGGLRNIWLTNGFERLETRYGEALTIQDLPGLTRAICKALIRKNSKLTGAEFRYLRQAMLMSQASLGRTLGRTDQAIAGWEKNSKVPKFADQMLRVVYAAHVDANEQVKKEDWSAIQETLYLLEIPGMRESIKDAMAQPLE